MRGYPSLFAVWALLLSPGSGINIVTTNDGTVLANAVISGPGVTVISGSFTGSSVAAGTFTNGPFGIGSGIILTTGSAAGALPGGDTQVANGVGGSNDYCGSDSFDGAILMVNLNVEPGFNGILVQLIIASTEEGESPDPVGVFLDGTQYANDANGQRLTAISSYIQPPVGITPPSSDTSYDDSSPPLLFGVPATSGSHTLVIAICDLNDESFDSGLMINVQGCTDCNQPIKINYVTTTTTVAANVATSTTSTIQASGTVSGTFIVTVQGEETTTTAEATTTTTAEETTTTAEDTTATTAEGTTTTTEADTTTPARVESTTTTEPGTTTEPEATTTTEAEAKTTTVVESSTTATDDETTTTDKEQLSTTAETSDTTTAEVEATTTTQSGTETTTMDMSTTTTSSTSTKETESATSSTETTEQSVSTPSTAATETIPRTEESTSKSLDVSSLKSTSIETQSPVIGSTTSSVTVPNVATTTTATTPEETESRTESASSQEVIESTTSAGPLPLTITSMEVSRVSTAPSSTVDQTASQSSVGARNLRTIDQYLYAGCLGSIERFPSFREVATDPDMTTEICVGLAAGSNYVGIYQQSCYAADSLTGDVLVPNDRCDLLCPGDPALFCGGNVAETQRRRAISSSRLFTLYERQADVPISSGLSTATDEITSSGPTITSLSLNPTVATETGISLSSEPVIIVPTSTEDRLPLTYPTIGTVHLTKGFNYTRTAAANTVTTVTYITVHPNNPGYLITTHVPVTIGYTPCNCDHQVYPPVDMTTIVTACHACGANGENSVTLTVPTAACEAGGAKPGYPHEVSYSAHKTMEHEIYSEVNSFAGPKPTQGQHAESLPIHGSPKPNSTGLPEPNGQDKTQPSRANAPPPVNTAPNASTVIEPPRPLPTSAYQVPASKAWTTEQHAPGQIHKPEATQVSYPAAPWDGQSTSTPVVVASATRHYLMPWTVAGIIFSVAFFLA